MGDTMACEDIDPAHFPGERTDDGAASPTWPSFAPYDHVYGVGGIVPKADGTISVGATAEHVGFDKAVTAGGITTLLTAVAKLTPELNTARFVRTWAGLRPGSADGLPLIGPSQSVQGLWIAGGHFRDGILLGPLTGHIVAELIQEHPTPFDLNLRAFDPDRFGGWESETL